MERRRPVGNAGAGLGGHRLLGGVGVDTHDIDAPGAKETDGQLTDEAEAHDHHRLAGPRVDQTEALQRDGRERREGRVFVGDAFRDTGGERRIGRDDLGVRGVGDDAVAGGEAGHLARIQHLADVAVAERDRLGELAADGGDGGEQAFGAHLRERRAEFLRLLARLAQPAAAAELDQHPLRAERDQRTRRPHEQAAATRTGSGHGEQFGTARTQMLDDLTQIRKGVFARWKTAR